MLLLGSFPNNYQSFLSIVDIGYGAIQKQMPHPNTDHSSSRNYSQINIGSNLYYPKIKSGE